MSLESRETFHGLENAVTSAAEDSIRRPTKTILGTKITFLGHK